MTSKNGLLITHSCLDCQIRILSDVHIEVLDSFDWQCLVFLERYRGVGRPLEYSVIAFLRAFVYMELSGMTSVRKLVRMLARDESVNFFVETSFFSFVTFLFYTNRSIYMLPRGL
ncbi:putative truncated transposase [Methanocella paludicola SANAE]|uniref:Truncated transposase n=1 Tax=Methanocella paludicola (strain DSM 17711 / JCM 13418 / NBRC 101707 / SANAE) TaxID=304371 RepID=D1YXP3_METPS|nr:putative truncated transposase [Methanocella paludicola SANAE]